MPSDIVDAGEIKKSIHHLYMTHPFPQWTKEERHRRLASELGRYHFLGLAPAMKDARFLDVGCGTGNRSMLAAKHFGVREFVGFDQSQASLAVAREVAEEEDFERFTAVEGDLFALPFPDASFDVVVSWGVLMVTPDPYRGLSEMVRVCCPGGFVGVFLYNPWNHWRHNMQKDKVSRLAGPDIERRFEVAHRLYGTKPIAAMSPEEIAQFYDKYTIPYKSEHTLGQTLGWFDRLGLEYWGSYPPLRFRDALASLQHRGELAESYPIMGRSTRWAVSAASRLPRVSVGGGPFRRPSRLHNFVWQVVYAWLGRGGAYSAGAAFSARKPLESTG